MNTEAFPQSLACFGATGGCTLAVLVRALQAGVKVNALARTPSKLTAALHARGIPSSLLDTNLTIITGDIRDIDAVSRTLVTYSTPGTSAPVDASAARLVDAIVSGIGGSPSDFKFQWSLFEPLVLTTQATICTDGMRTLTAAIAATRSRLHEPKHPLLVVFSTTGINREGPGDVPWLLVPLYHWLLSSPHRDKRRMERELERYVREEGEGEGGKQRCRVVVVRPTLLVDGVAKCVRVGSQERPAVGYWVSRESVRRWVWEDVVRRGGEGRGMYVSITS